MPKNLVAKASTTVNAPADKVWRGLVEPPLVKQYLFGTTVTSDWKKGSRIVWKGEWQGKAYEDKGVVLATDKPKKLQYTYLSSMSGKPDTPDNYSTITINLSPDGNRTRVSLSQDNNDTEASRDHSQQNWETVLAGLKKVVEAL
ncbi:MAG: SRPBCC family protein [Gemmatimonadaceae bacterium]